MKKITLHDLFQAKKERRQLTEIFTVDPLEAAACEAAGIEILVTITAHLKAIRAAAPNVFIIDVLGTNTGHVPPHSKVNGNLQAELQRVQQLRVDAFRASK